MVSQEGYSPFDLMYQDVAWSVCNMSDALEMAVKSKHSWPENCRAKYEHTVCALDTIKLLLVTLQSELEAKI